MNKTIKEAFDLHKIWLESAGENGIQLELEDLDLSYLLST
jgi:hypothetical protein